MKRFLFSFLFIQLALFVWGQNTVTLLIKDKDTGEPLPDISVQVRGSNSIATTSPEGLVILSLPSGRTSISISGIGFSPQTFDLKIPLPSPGSVFPVTLLRDEKIMEEVIISSTRTDSRIGNSATRVEVIGTEEVEEESAVKPANIASLLADVAGIQSQQTSAVTGNTDMRIQGVPGDYTQILRDGLPIFGGYSGSFSVLEIPPLDIRQIEIIKGASSTLYGGGAIAGMINIISKKPREGVQERSLLLNQSSLKESNITVFLSEREKKRGYTFFAAGTYQKQFDANQDGFSDLPLVENVQLHPSFFMYPDEKNTISVGLNSTFEERKGGDVLVLRNFIDTSHRFYILNRSYRNTLDATWDRKLGSSEKLSIRGTGTWYYRNISTNGFGLKAKQIAYFTEVSYVKKMEKHDIVAGINLSGEDFTKHLPDSSFLENYNDFTGGLFVQDDWRLHPKFILESGIRTDFHNRYGTFVLPRISLLYKISSSLSTRLGGGLGYKTPTLFNSEVDERDYRIIRFDPNSTVRPERSAGANWDFNYKKKFGEVQLTVNQFFYITRVNAPLVGFPEAGMINYRNAGRPILSKGFETWLMINWKGLDAYLGYTLTDARKKYDETQPFLELSARNKIASIVSYEFSRRLRACVEASLTGRQYLADGSRTPSYPIIAAMVRYDIRHFSFVLNGENIFDYRQTKKEAILIPPPTNPRFKQIWAPIDGRIINLSMRINF